LEIGEEIGSKRSLRELCIKLSKFGLTADDTVSAFNVLGDTAAEQIEENPYLLCKDGINFDFERADEIAASLNIPEDNLERICAGVLYVIKHNLLNGHTCLPMQKVENISKDLLGADLRVIDDSFSALLDRKEITKLITDGEEFVSLTSVFEHERYIATRLSVELLLPCKQRSVSDKELLAAEKELSIEFEQLQREAVKSSVTSGVFILTGGPGTGKTTAVNGIIKVMENRGMKVSLAAPTGRAAKRMTELTSHDAKTIHRLLEVGTSDDGKSHIFVRNEKNPLEADAVIIDEMSMVDTALFDALLRALKLGTRIVLVGDSDQLPSVGAGNILGDMIASRKFHCIKLKKVFRQALESKIVVNAHRIIDGEKMLLDDKDGDFFMLEQKTSSKAVSLITDLYCSRLPKAYGFSPSDDIEVLCPSKKMELGTVNLNNILQSQLNPPHEDVPEIAFKGFVLRKGDKVMQTKNNYDITWEDDNGNFGTGVFNGDVGILEDIDVKNRMLTVRFLDRVAEYMGEEVGQLELAYAVTVHKSQGSEFDCVILPILDFPYQLKYRNLLYTAVTRAKKLLICVGSRDVLEQMASNDRKTMRYTALKTLLIEGK
jgi:exodeoxyribonuclease V alpha subunit